MPELLHALGARLRCSERTEFRRVFETMNEPVLRPDVETDEAAAYAFGAPMKLAL